jgi:hypothetical protein
MEVGATANALHQAIATPRHSTSKLAHSTAVSECITTEIAIHFPPRNASRPVMRALDPAVRTYAEN